MRIKFLMRLKEINRVTTNRHNQNTIWQVVAENKFEKDILDYIDRFFEIETINDVDGVLTILDDELVYTSKFLKNNFCDKDFIDVAALGYINEKGGVLSTKPIYRCLEKLKEVSEFPSNQSGITFSKSSFSEFYKD